MDNMEIKEFDDLNKQKVKISGKIFEMSELTGGKWELFNQHIGHISRYERQREEDIEKSKTVAELLSFCKKEAMKVILPGADDEFLESQLSPRRLIEFIEIQKKLNGIDTIEKNQKSLETEI